MASRPPQPGGPAPDLPPGEIPPLPGEPDERPAPPDPVGRAA
ncbi:MAG: hypothetical protein ABIT69_04475 [Sphingomicrobium sp.]